MKTKWNTYSCDICGVDSKDPYVKIKGISFGVNRKVRRLKKSPIGAERHICIKCMEAFSK